MERGADPRSCCSYNRQLASVKLTQPPCRTDDICRSRGASFQNRDFLDLSKPNNGVPALRRTSFLSLSLAHHYFYFPQVPLGTNAHGDTHLCLDCFATSSSGLVTTSYPTPAGSLYSCPLGPSRSPPNGRRSCDFAHTPCTRRTRTVPHDCNTSGVAPKADKWVSPRIDMERKVSLFARPPAR